MESINHIQDEIVEEFDLMEDWADRYRYIIEIGQASPPLDENLKTDDRKIKGCQSNVWLNTEIEDGQIIFEADSDALITKGLVNLLIRILSKQSPDDILNCELYFIDKIGMQEHLSPTRANGLASMVKQMKVYAMAYKEKSRLES